AMDRLFRRNKIRSGPDIRLVRQLGTQTAKPLSGTTFIMDDLRKPILRGKGASDYERYLRTDELLSLQKLPEKFLHKDELTFPVATKNCLGCTNSPNACWISTNAFTCFASIT